MSRDKSDLLITAEEFDLLSEIEERLDEKTHSLTFDIAATNGKDNLLFQLREGDGLQLVANYGDYRLVFPVHLNAGDFANFRMSFNPPSIMGIYEHGEKLRSWRLLADKTISLVNEQGDALHYQVRDLSTSGISILIDTQEERAFPDLLNQIYLKLPNRERLAITGSKIRRIDNKTVAYLFGDSSSDALLTGLTEYLFERHLAKYPEVYKNKFK
jgi:hypothetical protein